MKQIIVVIGMSLLGCIIFDMMAGDGPDSLKTVSGAVIENSLRSFR